MKWLFSQKKNDLARFAGAGLSPNDPRLKERVNTAIEVLYREADFVGLTASYLFCTLGTDCITLPSDLETLLCWKLNDCAIGSVRSQYFAYDTDALYIGNGCCNQGNGQLSWGWGLNMIDVGFVTTLVDICEDSLIKVYADLPEDADAELLIKGKNSTEQVYTNHDGAWVDGEFIGIDNATPQTSVNLFIGQPFSITKPITNGPVRVYMVNPNTLVQSLICVLQPYEQSANFRRYRLPGLKFLNAQSGDQNFIRTICRKALRPVVLDTDELLISNIRALQLELKSQQFLDQDIEDKAEKYHFKAVEQLRKELAQYYGKNLRTNLQIQRQSFMGGGNTMI